VPSQRVMKGVIHSFLATYTSRRSDYRGYWTFGQLELGAEPIRIDLLAVQPEGETVADATRRTAIRRFVEQLGKVGLAPGLVREAILEISAIPEIVEGRHGEHMDHGRDFRFVARAVMDNGRAFRDQRVVFVAPHDPNKEYRRGPANWGG
jgi:hypothetical protein